MDDDILLNAVRIGTQALSEFGQMIMEPIFRGQLRLSDRENALGTSFYRLLAAVRTLSDLRRPYHFQTIAACTRLIFELCVDIDILANDRIERAVDKFHGFTRAARFSAAFKTVAFYNLHPDLEGPEDSRERRRLVESPGEQDAIEALCQDLWGSRRAPEHWTGLRWLEQVRLIGPEAEEDYVKWSQLFAWLVHGGGAAVGGLPPRAFLAIELRCRESAKARVPTAYHQIAVAMHMHQALPAFFEELARVKEKVEAGSREPGAGSLLHPFGRNGFQAPSVPSTSFGMKRLLYSTDRHPST